MTNRAVLTAVCAVGIIASHVDSTTTTSSSSSLARTTTTTTTAFAGCGGVERCLADQNCARCIKAINATPGIPHSEAEYNSIDRIQPWEQ
jgi:hypothetical protein